MLASVLQFAAAAGKSDMWVMYVQRWWQQQQKQHQHWQHQQATARSLPIRKPGSVCRNHTSYGAKLKTSPHAEKSTAAAAAAAAAAEEWRRLTGHADISLARRHCVGSINSAKTNCSTKQLCQCQPQQHQQQRPPLRRQFLQTPLPMWLLL